MSAVSSTFSLPKGMNEMLMDIPLKSNKDESDLRSMASPVQFYSGHVTQNTIHEQEERDDEDPNN